MNKKKVSPIGSVNEKRKGRREDKIISGTFIDAVSIILPPIRYHPLLWYA